MLEAQFDELMDRVIEASLIFERAFKGYLRDGYSEMFAEALGEVSELESRNDELKKEIETRLYEQTLIPDLRGDVLSLIAGLDGLLNLYQGNCFRISIEKPDIPSEFHRDFKALAKASTACVDSLIMASRAFFTNIEAVRDHSVKVMFFENEADKISTRLKTKVFGGDLPLDRKNQLRYFCDRIEEASNRAEDVADDLAIFTLKRST
jgi:predicted phosphate transport protein (TIGR00153 family)